MNTYRTAADISVFPLGLNFPTILIYFSCQVKSWQNGRSSECESWMSEMFSGADSTRT